MGKSTTTRRSRLGSKRQTSNGRWKVTVEHGVRADGRRRIVNRTVDTEEEADRLIEQLSIQMGAHPEMRRGVTLSHVWELYKATKGERLAKLTMRSYASNMANVWLPMLGDRDVTLITRQDVQDAMLTMTRDLADRSRRILSSVLTFAAKEGIIESNPIRNGGFELPGDTGSSWEDESAWDVDPFETIESGRDVWDARTVLLAFPLMRGLPLEPAWLAMVGGGLRLEEALAIRAMDVRRIDVGGRMVTQLAVHHARTTADERKRTKTRKSLRIVAVVEPFGERLWEIVEALPDRTSLICPVSASNQNHRWRGYFMLPSTSKHCAKSGVYLGRLHGLPYIPLSRMRATHATLMQEAGVLDSLNAAVHGHSMQVSRDHYLRGDTTMAATQTGQYLRLVM